MKTNLDLTKLPHLKGFLDYHDQQACRGNLESIKILGRFRKKIAKQIEYSNFGGRKKEVKEKKLLKQAIKYRKPETVDFLVKYLIGELHCNDMNKNELLQLAMLVVTDNHSEIIKIIKAINPLEIETEKQNHEIKRADELCERIYNCKELKSNTEFKNFLELLKQQSDPRKFTIETIVNSLNCNLLHYAVASNNRELVKYLVDNSTNLNSLLHQKDNEYGMTPLLCAAWHGHEQIFADLYREESKLGRHHKLGHNFIHRDNKFRSAVTLAAKNDHTKFIQTLINNPDYHNELDMEFYTTWVDKFTTEFSLTEDVQNFSAKKMHRKESGHYTALMYAAWHGNIQLVQALIEYYASKNVVVEHILRKNKYGNNAFLLAAIGCDCSVRCDLEIKYPQTTDELVKYRDEWTKQHKQGAMLLMFDKSQWRVYLLKNDQNKMEEKSIEENSELVNELSKINSQNQVFYDMSQLQKQLRTLFEDDTPRNFALSNFSQEEVSRLRKHTKETTLEGNNLDAPLVQKIQAISLENNDWIKVKFKSDELAYSAPNRSAIPV